MPHNTGSQKISTLFKQHALSIGVGLASVYYIGLFIIAALFRIRHLGEFDLIESISMTQAQRFILGLPIYQAPTLDYAPIMYGPVYPGVVSLAVRLLGPEFSSGRLISLLATGLSMLFIGKLIYFETARKGASLFAVGLFIAIYDKLGFWQDMARVDSLYLAFLMAGLYFLKRDMSAKGVLFAAICLSLSALTKQTALVLLVSIIPWAVWRDRKSGILFSVLALSFCGLGFGALDWMSQGWSTYYLFQVPSTHTVNWGHGFKVISKQIILPYFIGGVFCFLTFQDHLRRPHKRVSALFYLVLLGAIFQASFLALAKVGGNYNNLVPLMAILAIFFALAYHHFYSKSEIRFVLALIFIYFYNSPTVSLPTVQQEVNAKTLREMLGRESGKVFAPFDSYVLFLSTKNHSAHWSPLVDTILADNILDKKTRMYEMLFKAFEEKTYSLIVIDKSEFFEKERFPFSQLQVHYEQKEDLTNRLFYRLRPSPIK